MSTQRQRVSETMPEKFPLASVQSAVAICLILAANPYKSLAFELAEKETPIVGQVPESGPGYPVLADHVTSAPLIIKIRIKKANQAPVERAGTPPTGYSRLLLKAQVIGLIRGEGGVAPQITYFADVALDSRGKPPRLGKRTFVIFARPGARPDLVQLVSRNAQMPWSPVLESRVRALTGEVLKADSPPRILGVGDAFFINGAVAGESDTQIFLKTQNEEPVSLSISRRPGQPPHWSVSLGEVVDETAAPPARDTLLWYRLVCALPVELPVESTRGLPVQDAEAASADYRFVMQTLGTCDRTL